MTKRRLIAAAVLVGAFLMAMVAVGVWAESDFWLIALPAYVTGVGTLALAVATVVLATGDRARDDAKRAEDRRLAAEDARIAQERSDTAARQAGAEAEATLRREWAHQEELRRFEFQRQYGRELIETLIQFKPVASYLSFDNLGEYDSKKRQEAIAALRRTTTTTVLLIGHPEVTARFERLLLLADRAEEHARSLR